jgi:hypothetical protein
MDCENTSLDVPRVLSLSFKRLLGLGKECGIGPFAGHEFVHELSRASFMSPATARGSEGGAYPVVAGERGFRGDAYTGIEVHLAGRSTRGKRIGSRVELPEAISKSRVVSHSATKPTGAGASGIARANSSEEQTGRGRWSAFQTMYYRRLQNM